MVEDSGRGTKRLIPEDECLEESSQAVSKKLKNLCQPVPTKEMDTSKSALIREEKYDMNFPLPWERGTPCIVKVRETDILLVETHSLRRDKWLFEVFVTHTT